MTHMTEYIDKTEAMRRFKPFGREIPKDQVMAVLARIDEGIVRCKDCKHRDKFGCHNPIWGDGWANYPAPSTKDTDFCAYGERSEE